MSLPLVTARTAQHMYFQLDTDTLETHSNVAGTGQAGARVIVAFGSGLKERVRSNENALRKTERFRRTTNREWRIPPFDFREVT
jgi:hypothetical protein